MNTRGSTPDDPFRSPVLRSWDWITLACICLVACVAISVALFQSGGGLASQLFPAAGIVISMLALILSPTRQLQADASGVTLTRSTAPGLFRRAEHFERSQIRRIRYRMERRVRSDEGDDFTYIIDLITTDGRIIKLLVNKTFPPDATLSRRLAERLDVQYEEYLES